MFELIRTSRRCSWDPAIRGPCSPSTVQKDLLACLHGCAQRPNTASGSSDSDLVGRIRWGSDGPANLRSTEIVIVLPRRECGAGVIQRRELGDVQALVARSTVIALGNGRRRATASSSSNTRAGEGKCLAKRLALAAPMLSAAIHPVSGDTASGARKGLRPPSVSLRAWIVIVERLAFQELANKRAVADGSMAL